MTTSRYPLIEKLQLPVYAVHCNFVDSAMGKKHQCGDEFLAVKIDDLEALLAKAPRVNGRIDGDFGWFDRTHNPFDSVRNDHTALLLAIEPIEKAVTKDEVCNAIQMAHKTNFNSLVEILHRIADHGYKNEGTK